MNGPAGIGQTDDDNSFDTMFIVGQASSGNNTSYWIADNAGLGVIYTMITSSGDKLVWSN